MANKILIGTDQSLFVSDLDSKYLYDAGKYNVYALYFNKDEIIYMGTFNGLYLADSSKESLKFMLNLDIPSTACASTIYVTKHEMLVATYGYGLWIKDK